MGILSQRPLAQAGAIPFRDQGPEREFCLITSARRGRWGFPKGIIEPHQTPIDAALQEAEEEAGVRGHIVEPVVGHYDYEKWHQTLRVQVFLLRVTETLRNWPEMSMRERRWCTGDEVLQLVDKPALLDIFSAALSRLEDAADL